MFFLGITDMFHNNKIAKTDKYVLWQIKKCGQTIVWPQTSMLIT